MNELKCPHCGEVFQVDESGYASIAQQVRDQEFEKELERREQARAEKHQNDLKVARMEQEQSHAANLAQKDAEIANKDRLIAELQSKLSNGEIEKKLAISEALQMKEKEITDKTTEII